MCESDKYLKGSNADLWRIAYAKLAPILKHCKFIKVKSHIDNMEDWIKSGATKISYKLNSLADVASNEAAKMYYQNSRNTEHIIKDSKEQLEAYQISLRLAAIEVHCFDNYDYLRPKMRKPFDTERISNRIKRKNNEPVDNTTI